MIFCVWNWNWKLTLDHVLIKHWSQRTYRCSAPVVGLEEYSAGEPRPRYNALQSLGESWACESNSLHMLPCHGPSYPTGVACHTLTHWGRVTHICVAYLTDIASDNGLSPSRCQAIIWTNTGILLIGRLGTNFSEILIEIHAFSFKKMHLKMSSAIRRPFCLGLNVLISHQIQCYRTAYNQPLSGIQRDVFLVLWFPNGSHPWSSSTKLLLCIYRHT